MAPRIPKPPPHGDIDLLDLLWEKLTDAFPLLGTIDGIVDAIRAAVTGGSFPGGDFEDLFDDLVDFHGLADGAASALNQVMDILAGLAVTPINSAVGAVKDWFNGLTGWQSSTDAIVAGHGTALTTLTDQMVAMKVTQAYVSLDQDDMPSFPRDLLSPIFTGGTHNHGAGTLDANTTSGDVSGNTSQTSLGIEMPTVTPGKDVIDYVMITVDRGPKVRPRYLKIGTGDAGFWGSIFGINNWYVGLYVFNPATSQLVRLYDSGDQKANLTTAEREYAFDMGTGLGELFPGQILFGAQLQRSGVLVSTRAIAGIRMPKMRPSVPGIFESAAYTSSGSSLPTSIAKSSLTPNYDYKPWMAVKTEAI